METVEVKEKGFFQNAFGEMGKNAKVTGEISRLFTDIIRMGTKELHRQAKNPIQSHKHNQEKVLEAMQTVHDFVEDHIGGSTESGTKGE